LVAFAVAEIWMRLVTVVTAAICVAIGFPGIGSPAFAEPPGLAKKGGLPPGLAKKAYGLPPGQAKKLYGKGERIPAEYYQQPEYYIVRPQIYGLTPPPPGYRWVLVDGNGYLVATETGLIASVVASLIR
jgi:hypothetical protein